MRRNKFLTGILTLVVVLALAGCDLLYIREAGEIDTDLVGVWFWDDNSGFEYQFNDDGTGIRGWPGEPSLFTWSTNGSTLNIECRGTYAMFGVRSERWTYVIAGDKLTLTSQQSRNLSYSYIRDGVLGNVVPELIGTWFWEESIYWTYVFHEDGTGTAGWIFDEFDFSWGATDNILRVERLGEIPKYNNRIDTWHFYIEDGLLHLTDPSEETFFYYRDYRNWEADPALANTWAWVEYTGWMYVLNEDGTATRGTDYDYFEFTWGANGNELRLFYNGTLFESWFFSITGNRLRLEDRYDPDTVFYYISFDDLDELEEWLEEIFQESQSGVTTT